MGVASPRGPKIQARMRRLPHKPKSSRRAAKAPREQEIVAAPLRWGAGFRQ
jgi:hypothetical protein